MQFHRAVISGEDTGVSAQRLLPWLYTQDTEQEVWQDRTSWVKSNPTLGIVKKWDYLDEQIKEDSRKETTKVTRQSFRPKG